MTTSDLERQLAVVLQRHAEDAMNRTDTGAKLEDLLDGAQEDLRRRRRRTWAAGLVAAAASIALIAAALIFAVNRDDAVEPVQPTPATPAERVASAFFDAYMSNDRQRMASYLADNASMQDMSEAAWSRWRLAAGFRTLNESCQQQAARPEGTRVVCSFDFHMLGSNEIGRGPFSGDTLAVTVNNGKIAAAVETNTFLTNGFSDQMWEPFAGWVAAYHPSDAEVMYEDWPSQSSARLTGRSLALWTEHVQNYVAANE